MTLLEKIIAGTFVIVGLGLLLTHPAGDTALGTSIQNLYVGGVKQLQAG